jgi:hypothetical protein
MRPDTFVDRLLPEPLEPLAAFAAPALAPTRFAPRGTVLAPLAFDLAPRIVVRELPLADREVPAPEPAREPSSLRGTLVAAVVGSWATVVAILGACALMACNGPRVIHEGAVLATGARVPTVDAAAASARPAADQQRMRDAHDSAFAAASAACVPAVCAALARGELAIGMTEGEVRAATRSAPAAWSVRDAGGTSVMVAASLAKPPADAVGEVAMVQLREGRVASVSYREPQGVRVVQSAQDATAEGRARATAEALVREGDAYNAAGDRAAALDRYDRALVFLPDDAMLQYRIATLLDLQLRPIEALIRYQRFLNQLRIDRIDAIGNANAKLGEAIARAQQRILILERQTR